MFKIKQHRKIYIFCLSILSIFALSYNLHQRFFVSPDLTIIGYVNLTEGLGRQSAELINAFKDEVNINLIPTRKNVFNDVPKAVRQIAKQKNRKLGKVVLFEDFLWQPNDDYYQKLLEPLKEQRDENRICIAYSMFESTKIPQMWTILLNKHFDAVAVPDKFLIDVYKNSGVTIPIFELPLGLDLTNFLKKPLKETAHTPFVFANFSAHSDRKNQLMLVRAFAKRFGNNPKVKLMINSRYGEKEVRNAITREILDLGLENVEFTHFSRDQQQYLEQFKKVDCYVSLSKGEGFSIQPREAMALGIPVIAANNTAQSTICESQLIKTIASTHLEPALFPCGDYYGYSFNCEIDEVATALSDVYENYDFWLQKAQAARNWAEQYQYTHLKGLYSSLLKPKKVVLGNENKITNESIITNSETLYKKYRLLINSP